MRIKLLKLQKNRRFNYTPRYYKGKDVGNPFDFGSKFSKFRDIHNENDRGQHWKEARVQMRTRSNRSFSLRLLWIILALALAFWWLLDLDISLFYPLR